MDRRVVIGVLVASLTLIFGSVFLINKNQTVQVENKEGKPNVELEVTSKDWTRGAKKPIVTLVEYGDFQCPACGAYHEVVAKLMADFPETLRFVFRHYPLTNLHKNAFEAAKSVEAAGRQGKFWEMYDKVYVGQKDWYDLKNASEIFTVYAKDLKLDLAKYDLDKNSKEAEQSVQEGLISGNKLGISGTPTFYINGVVIGLPGSYEKFKELINARIASAPPEPTTVETEKVHKHADFVVYKDGKKVDFSKDQYQSKEGAELNEYVHLHDGNGRVIHQHKAGVTLGVFFDSIKYSLTDKTRFWVNGVEQKTLWRSYDFNDLDKLVFVDGVFNESMLKNVSDDACMYSEKCPERGKPPTESCVGGLDTPCK